MKRMNVRHGHASTDKPTRVYKAWINMKTRCYNKNQKRYHRYGGRGIVVCKRWRDSFELFLKDMGEPEKGFTLDRINNDGNYTKSNCRWATFSKQNENRGKLSGRSSKYKNVYFEKRSGRFIAEVKRNKIRKHVGSHSTERGAYLLAKRYIDGLDS